MVYMKTKLVLITILTLIFCFHKIEGENKGNNDCAKWCHENFSGKEAGKCVSQAAKSNGPCYICGPEAPAGHPDFCNGCCCTSGQVCVNGTCQCPSGVLGDNNNCKFCGDSCRAGRCDQNLGCICSSLGSPGWCGVT